MGIFDYWKREKPKPDFSTARGGSSSTPAAPAPAKADGDSSVAGAVEATTYLVLKGDSLSTIASGQYGTAQKWRRIYDANRDLIEDPDFIYPGQKLRIPE